MSPNRASDDEPISPAAKPISYAEKKAAVQAALRKMIEQNDQAGIRTIFGKPRWEDDPDATRDTRPLAPNHAPQGPAAPPPAASKPLPKR